MCCASGPGRRLRSSSSSSGSVKLNLVAYSTPAAVYAKLIPAFNKTAAGKGVGFTQSYGASGDQSRAVAAGQPADVVALLARARHRRAWCRPTWSRPTGTRTSSTASSPTRSWSSSCARATPRTSRPGHDLTKPGVQVVTPNPFTSGGARWNIMAAYGAQLKQGKSPAEAQAYLGQLFKNVVVQPDSAARRAADLRRRQGRRPARLRERRHPGPAEGRGGRLRHPRADDPDPDARRGDIGLVAPDAGQGVPDFLYVEAGSADLRRQRLPAGAPGRHVPKYSYPTPPQLFDINYVGGWDLGHDQVLRSHERDRGQDRADATESPLAAEALPARNAASAPTSGSNRAWWWGWLRRGSASSCCCPSPRSSTRRSSAAGALLDGDHATRRRCRAEADARRRLRAGGHQRGLRDADRVDAGARQLPRAGGHQRADRPAVRAADDRRRPGAPVLYGPGSPLGINIAYTRRRSWSRSCSRRCPFVVRSVQPVLMELDREMEEAAASLGAGT